MKKWSVVFFTLMAWLMLSPVMAAVPEAIKYQAVVRDNAGNVLANRNVGIRLSILQGITSGPAVYTERHAPTSNALGIINLDIGKGTVLLGDIGAIQWGANDYFIKIEMDENGGSNYTLIGTSQLVSVPYAFYAEEAGNGTQWQDSVNNIYYSTGKVGVGTENPKSSLEIYSGSRLGSQVRITGETPTLRFSDTAYAGNGVVIGVAADSNDLIPRSGQGDLVFSNEAYGEGGGYIFGTNVPAQTCVKITKDCQVGIGTDAPVSKLDVKSGDLNIRDIGSGVIMRSPDGNCWRLTVSNAGAPVYTSVNCLTGATINTPPNYWNAVAVYQFDKTNGANDLTSNQLDGTPVNAQLGQDRKGNDSSAYRFTSTGQYVDLPNFSSMIGGEEFSVSIWTKAETQQSNTPFALNPDDANNRILAHVNYYTAPNVTKLIFDVGNFSSGRHELLNQPFTTSWEHYVFVASQSQDIIKVYRNGILVIDQTGYIVANKNKTLRIAAPFFGYIDDVRIFNRALTASEAIEIYNTEK